MRLLLVGLTAAFWLFTIPVTVRADFIVTQVVSPGDPAYTKLLGINNSTTIAGYFGDGSSISSNGFTLTLPNTFSPENFPGAAQTVVSGINGAGNTAGFYIDTGGTTHGFVDIGSTFATVDSPGTTFNELLGLNDSDQAAGFYQSGSDQFAYTYFSGVFTPLTSFFPVGTTISEATDVNNAGDVTGFYGSNGFLIASGVLTTLDYPGAASTKALGLNNMGQVVGEYVDSLGVTHGFVFDGVHYTSFDVPGSVSTVINGINDSGQIVGFFLDTNQNTVGFEGNPTATPEPRDSVLAALAVLAIGILGKYRSRYSA
jgi:uncharacterized membrane protein